MTVKQQEGFQAVSEGGGAGKISIGLAVKSAFQKRRNPTRGGASLRGVHEAE